MPKTIIKIQVQDSANAHIHMYMHRETRNYSNTHTHTHALTYIVWPVSSDSPAVWAVPKASERARKKEPTTTTRIAHRQRQARSKKRKTTKRRSNCRCNACTRTPHQPAYALPLAPSRKAWRPSTYCSFVSLPKRSASRTQRHMARLLKTKERQKIAANWRERNRLQLKIEQMQQRRQQQ